MPSPEPTICICQHGHCDEACAACADTDDCPHNGPMATMCRAIHPETGELCVLSLAEHKNHEGHWDGAITTWKVGQR